MGRSLLSHDVVELVANRFKALAEPANVSKHLQLLHTLGFVHRRKAGLYVFYTLADRQVLQLCNLMCTRVRETTLESS